MVRLRSFTRTFRSGALLEKLWIFGAGSFFYSNSTRMQEMNLCAPAVQSCPASAGILHFESNYQFESSGARKRRPPRDIANLWSFCVLPAWRAVCSIQADMWILNSVAHLTFKLQPVIVNPHKCHCFIWFFSFDCQSDPSKRPQL